MQSIPVSLDEAAMIGGAHRWTMYWRIVVPLLKPAIATVVIIKGIAVYNEFYAPFLYLPSEGPHLDVAVPVHRTVRRPVGGHRRRHDHRHHPDPHRLPPAAAVDPPRPDLWSVT
jgi:ABC-type glycerol-3-phosphate transport system permease component